MSGDDIELSIIVPTYDEAMNVQAFVSAVLEQIEKNDLRGEVVVVDDDSPDGTGDIVESMRADHPDLVLVVRKDERGASSAIVRGFEEARGDILCVMDADFSHPPDVMPRLVAPILSREADMAIASRYVEGGGVENWPLKRKLISKGATLMARPITSVRDPMSGFFAIRRRVIEGLELRPKSCKICLDIVARGDVENLVEVPFIFPERQAGESKLSNSIMTDYVSHLFALLFAKNSTFKRFFKFCVVGALGTLVNLSVLFASVEWLGLWYIYGAVLAYAIALIHNFTLNKLWTFGDRRSEAKVVLGSLGRYFLVTTGGLAINLTVLFILTDLFDIWYIYSQVFAIICEVVWNFSRSRAWAFKESG